MIIERLRTRQPEAAVLPATAPDIIRMRASRRDIDAVMKTLLILRHAKSSWKHPETTDHDRSLNKRGKRDAPRMGRVIAEQDLCPDLILSSTARRARLTAEAVAAQAGYRGAVRLERRLYLANPAEIIDVIRESAADAARVMVVGHNPGLEELVTRLGGSGEAIPTAALAQIQLDIAAWTDLSVRSPARVVNLWRPRELPSDES